MAGKFHGGVHPDDAKSLSNACAVGELPVPSEVVLPVRQHIGAPANIIVQPKDTVRKGQVVAEAGGFVSAPVHASISGTVTAVESRFTPLGARVPCVVIEGDGADTWADGLDTPRDPGSMTPDEIKTTIRDAGIVGLGGAAFPTHVKLSPPADKHIDTVIMNGVECEPYATCDHRLMLERPGDIIEGLKLIMTVLHCSKAYIGIEANKPDAVKALRGAIVGEAGIKVVSLPVKYPQGGEKQLIKAVTGREVPSGGLPMDAGCVVQNVATAAAVYDAVARNRPLVERVVTVTGPGVKTPCNIRVRIGDSFARLIEHAGGYTDDAAKLINGGPMMGIAQFTDSVPVVKGTSCILVLSKKQTELGEERPCIGCGRCIEICPVSLMATSIARRVEFEKWDEAQEFSIMDCIECGACTYICPAKRMLAERIKFGKYRIAAIRTQEQAKRNEAVKSAG